jgi:hypothetical protein
MPNWKKVIVSGSDASLNSITTPAGTINNITASFAVTASYALTASYTPAIAGTDNYIPKFNGLSALENSVMYESGSNIGIGTTSPSYKTTIYSTSTTDSFPLVIGQPNNANEFVGIGLSGFVASNGAVKAGFVLDRQTTYGVGDIHILNNTTLDNSNATLSDSKLVIKQSGNVGIGTTSPSQKLDVSGSIAISKNAEYIYGKTSSGGNVRLLGINAGNVAYVGAIDSGPISTIFNASSTSTIASFYTSGSERIRIDSLGNVGIGTTSPSQKLDVTTSGYDGITLTRTAQSAGSLLSSRAYDTSNTLRTSNRITFGSTAGSGAADGYIIFETAKSNTLTERMRIISSGNVGIGTSTPSSSLHVAGTTHLSGSFNTAISGSILTVVGSGSAQPIFTVQGSQGELFSITDSLSGSLFSVNDISGLPILEVFSDNTTLIGNYQDPMLITTTKLVTTASGAFTLYSLPTASYDTAFFEYSIKSGSNARAGTIMAVQLGSSVNFTETTTTDFGSTSGFGFTVQVAGANMILTGSATTSGWTIKTIVRGI